MRDAPIFESPEDTQEVLYAAVYLVGEFSKYATHHTDLMVSLLQPRVISLPAHVQAVYMQNVLKIFAHVANAAANGDVDEDEDTPKRTKIDESTLDRIIEIMQQRLPLFKQSAYLEVQERVLSCPFEFTYFLLTASSSSSLFHPRHALLLSCWLSLWNSRMRATAQICVRSLFPSSLFR